MHFLTKALAYALLVGAHASEKLSIKHLRGLKKSQCIKKKEYCGYGQWDVMCCDDLMCMDHKCMEPDNGHDMAVCYRKSDHCMTGADALPCCDANRECVNNKCEKKPKEESMSSGDTCYRKSDHCMTGADALPCCDANRECVNNKCEKKPKEESMSSGDTCYRKNEHCERTGADALPCCDANRECIYGKCEKKPKGGKAYKGTV